MKKTVSVVFFFLACATVITIAVKAGLHHSGCAECRLGYRDTSSLAKK